LYAKLTGDLMIDSVKLTEIGLSQLETTWRRGEQKMKGREGKKLPVVYEIDENTKHSIKQRWRLGGGNDQIPSFQTTESWLFFAANVQIERRGCLHRPDSKPFKYGAAFRQSELLFSV
jgi:hypothetical protein